VISQHLDLKIPGRLLFYLLIHTDGSSEAAYSTAPALANYLDDNLDVLRKMFIADLELLIVTVDKTGSLVVNKANNGYTIILVSIPDILREEVISVAGAGDW